MPSEVGTSEERTSPSRKWHAIGVATLAMILCYSAILFGLVSALSGEGDEGVALILAIGLAGVPAVFMTLGFVSRHPRAPYATIKAMGLFLLIGFSVSLLDLPAGLVGGFGAGGIVALKLETTDTVRARVWAVVLTTAYIMLIGRIVPSVGALAGSVFPFLAIGAADSITRRRAEASPDRL